MATNNKKRSANEQQAEDTSPHDPMEVDMNNNNNNSSNAEGDEKEKEEAQERLSRQPPQKKAKAEPRVVLLSPESVADGEVDPMYSNLYHLAADSEPDSLPRLRQLLESGRVTPDCVKDHRLRTPLMMASRRKDELNVAAVKLLLQYGADVALQSRKGWTALHFAAYGGRAAVVEVLLQAGSDPNHCNTIGKIRSPLSRVVQRHVDYEDEDRAAELLIAAGADVHFRFGDLKAPLVLWACTKGTPRRVRALVEAGASLEERDNNGCDAFTLLCANRVPQYAIDIANFIVQKLGRAKASEKVRTHDEYGLTPVYRAARSAPPEVLELYLLLGGNPNYNKDTSSLLMALHKQDDEERAYRCLALLLQAGASETFNEQEICSLFGAIQQDYLKCVKLLLQHQAQHGPMPTGCEWDIHRVLHVTATERQTALDRAVQFAGVAMVRFVLDAGVHRMNEGLVARLVCRRDGDAAGVLRVLLERGIVVASQEQLDEWLTGAVGWGVLPMVELLLEAGASPNAFHKDSGAYAVDRLFQSDDEEQHVVKLKALLRAGLDLTLRGPASFPVLHYACCFSSLECIQFLLRYGVSAEEEGPHHFTVIDAILRRQVAQFNDICEIVHAVCQYLPAQRIWRHHLGMDNEHCSALLLQEAAVAGYAPAMVKWATKCLMHGYGGVTQDANAALYWLRRAAALNDASAIANLGLFYQHGVPGKRDAKRALQLYERAYALGEYSKLQEHATMLANGEGCTPSVEKAIALLDHAMQQLTAANTQRVEQQQQQQQQQEQEGPPQTQEQLVAQARAQQEFAEESKRNAELYNELAVLKGRLSARLQKPDTAHLSHSALTGTVEDALVLYDLFLQDAPEGVAELDEELYEQGAVEEPSVDDIAQLVADLRDAQSVGNVLECCERAKELLNSDAAAQLALDHDLHHQVVRMLNTVKVREIVVAGFQLLGVCMPFIAENSLAWDAAATLVFTERVSQFCHAGLLPALIRAMGALSNPVGQFGDGASRLELADEAPIILALHSINSMHETAATTLLMLGLSFRSIQGMISLVWSLQGRAIKLFNAARAGLCEPVDDAQQHQQQSKAPEQQTSAMEVEKDNAAGDP